MQDFTQNRTEVTPDEIWVVEHPAVFTQGLNGKAEHILTQPTHIPIVQTDRGGQITYHGPGQLVMYVLIDLKRAKLSVRHLVHTLEDALIQFLASFNITAIARADAPGVYVNQQKIASLGLKVKKHRSYHGLALNVNMDLAPFKLINPCGLADMEMTQLSDQVKLDPQNNIDSLGETLSKYLMQLLPTTQF